MSKKATYLIELNGIRYEVRVVKGDRQIKHDGKWIPVSKFIDDLIDREQWHSVLTLAELGRKVLEKSKKS